MRGFQLWLNLPAAEKMKPAAYRDIPSADIPVVALPGGGEVKVIAGEVRIDGIQTSGPISGLSTEPLYWDVRLLAGGSFSHAIKSGHNVFIYVYEGEVVIGDRKLSGGSAGLLSDGDEVSFTAGDEGARLLLLAGKPLREPIAQYGPFVMNTQEEIEQAINDYRAGRLAEG